MSSRPSQRFCAVERVEHSEHRGAGGPPVVSAAMSEHSSARENATVAMYRSPLSPADTSDTTSTLPGGCSFHHLLARANTPIDSSSSESGSSGSATGASSPASSASAVVSRVAQADAHAAILSMCPSGRPPSGSSRVSDQTGRAPSCGSSGSGSDPAGSSPSGSGSSSSASSSSMLTPATDPVTGSIVIASSTRSRPSAVAFSSSTAKKCSSQGKL